MCVACRAQVSLSGEEGKEKGSGGREVQKYILTIHEVYGWRRVPHGPGTKNFTPTSPERRLTPDSESEFFFFFFLHHNHNNPISRHDAACKNNTIFINYKLSIYNYIINILK